MGARCTMLWPMQRRGNTRPGPLTARTGLSFGIAALSIAGLAFASGCDDVEELKPVSVDAGADAALPEPTSGRSTTSSPSAPPLPGESACKVVETTGIEVAEVMHQPLCTPLEYATNPPSGGDHWALWADYAKYTAPVPREMYVHNLEHGGVVLSYRCKDACPAVVAAIESVFDAAVDPFCFTQTPRARVVITPDPDLPAPIAASAWGATYVATCIDTPSLLAFVNRSIDHGTERICAGNSNPADVAAACGGSRSSSSAP
jgi:Protein of unknown function (DUF3105)